MARLHFFGRHLAEGSAATRAAHRRFQFFHKQIRAPPPPGGVAVGASLICDREASRPLKIADPSVPLHRHRSNAMVACMTSGPNCRPGCIKTKLCIKCPAAASVFASMTSGSPTIALAASRPLNNSGADAECRKEANKYYLAFPGKTINANNSETIIYNAQVLHASRDFRL